MTPAEIKAAAAKAREFEVTRDGITLRLRLPTEVQLRVLMRKAPPLPDDSIDHAALQPVLMQSCVIGWSGPTYRHLGIDMDGYLPFGVELIEDVLSRWPALYDEAYVDVLRRYNEAAEKRQAELKN